MMNTAVSATFLCLAMAVTGAPTADAQSYTRLSDSEFVVAGIGPGADSSLVHKLLGAPSHKTSATWQYNGIEVVFANAVVDWVRVRSRRYSTRRGLRVGDDETRITALYGRTCGPPGSYTFCGPEDHRGLMVIVQHGKVIELRIGPQIDHD